MDFLSPWEQSAMAALTHHCISLSFSLAGRVPAALAREVAPNHVGMGGGYTPSRADLGGRAAPSRAGQGSSPEELAGGGGLARGARRRRGCSPQELAKMAVCYEKLKTMAKESFPAHSLY